MQIDATSRCQDTQHLQQPYRHHAQVRFHAGAMGNARRLDHLVHGRVLVGDQPDPRKVKIVQCPGILKRGFRRLAADRCRVGAIRVERRVQVDQVYRFGIEPAQDIEIVTRPYRARGKVALRLVE